MRKTPHPQTCERCPNRFALRGCPCWIGPEAGFLETNIQTGEERIVTGCFYAIIPRMLAHVVRASNRPAAAFEDLRNRMLQGFTVLGQAIEAPQKVRLGGPDA